MTRSTSQTLASPLIFVEAAKPYSSGCGRDWVGEVYTTLSGLPYLLAESVERDSDHELASSPLDAEHLAFALRGLRQQGTRWPSASSMSRRARWGCTWPHSRWPSSWSSS